ncbi:MAG: hypothetical protein P0111_10545 [Nitrospira sp.]|nr:hypothetical protein [Nitrospira sp.]
MISLILGGCTSDPIEQYYKAQREAQQQAAIAEEVKRKERAYDTELEFSPLIAPGHRLIPVALVEPMITVARCEGDPILMSLPEEFACEQGKYWVYQPSQRILPPADLLLVSLRFTGLSVSSHPSLAEARKAGAKAAILTVITRADCTVWPLKDFYRERRINADDVSNGALSRAIGTVKMHATIVRLDSGDILWKGPVLHVMEQTVPSLPLADDRAKIESAAGTGRFEMEAYGLRSVVVQAYAQAARHLAKQIDGSLKEMAQ